ncbi:hypothetical protein ACEPAI_2501 [Sanghuangporus weigelae]
MLSFINMGGRKKRQRKKGSIRGNGGSGTRGNRRVSRGSGSFMSPGNIGEITEKPVAQCSALNERAAAMEKKVVAGITSIETPTVPTRSPEIQLEFKHDSLLQSLPEEYLRYRKGSTSSSQREVGIVRSSSQTADWTLNMDGSPQGKRLTQEKRRMAPLPTVAPIKIPASPVKTVSTKSRRASRVRRSIASNSPAWASDSEISPVSGLSAARDVLAETFTFSARTAGFIEPSGKEKEIGNRMARQDSATLPKDAIWESSIRSPSVSRKSSTHSVKKRKLDTTALDLPPFEAFVLSSPFLRRDGENVEAKNEVMPKEQLPPRNDSIRGHRREGSLGMRRRPPGLTPSAQKLDHTDQAALHRVSRILETDAEVSNASVSQPASSLVNGSFPSPGKKDVQDKSDRFQLGSPFKLPSAVSTPSTYSKYTASPYSSPGKRPVLSPQDASPGNLDPGYESFLEDFDFVGPSSGPSSRGGGRSGYAGSADSPYEAQMPMTAASMSSVHGLKSAPAGSSSGFPKAPLRHPPLVRMHSPGTSRSNSIKDSPSSAYSSPSGKGKGPAVFSPGFLRNRNRSESVSSTSASVGKSTMVTSIGDSRKEAQSHTPQAKTTASADNNNTNTCQRQSKNDKQIQSTLKVTVLNPTDTGPQRPQCSPLRLRVTNPKPSPSPVTPSPLSCRSPDLLDMLIPNGHIVTPISRRQMRRKGSGTPPNPIKITPSRSDRYLPLNGDVDHEAGRDDVQDCEPGCEPRSGDTPSTGGTQTFPETPVLFSPDILRDALSRSNSILSAVNQPIAGQKSLFRDAIAFQPIIIPSTPCITEPTKDLSTGSVAVVDSVKNESSSQISASTSSPPISPLQPPPCSPITAIPRVQTLTDTSRPSPPLLGPVPRRRTVHMRPPLPFGPRQPNSVPGKGTAPLSFSFRRAASESAAGISQSARKVKSQLSRPVTPLSTPTFKTTSVPWRALTLEAAKWTFSSTQLQAIVRSAIEESAQASSIRLLPQDVFDEMPTTVSMLESRRTDLQNDYKVTVRRRRSIIQRLASLSSNDSRTDSMAVVRDAEELASVTAAGDKIVEQLHEIDDQITQVHRLRDVHQASALAVALRKLNSSLLRQTSEMEKLRLAVTNLYAERDEAWRKAEELECELDAAYEHADYGRPKSVSSSRRSSRVSLARKSSSRTSKAGLRLSGYSNRRASYRSSNSSLYVHHSSSARTTFSSDIIPPVPPLPNLDPPILTSTAGFPSSHPSTSMPQSSAMPSTNDNLYNVVYDLLGVKGSDRAMPSPSRPHSAIHSTTAPPSEINSIHKHTGYVRLEPSFQLGSITRLRSGSLPTLIPPHRDEEDETGAIIAVLDFRD